MDEFNDRMKAQFRHNFCAVRFHSPHGDTQLLRNLFICFPLGQEQNDCSLTRRWSASQRSNFFRVLPGPEKSFQD